MIFPTLGCRYMKAGDLAFCSVGTAKQACFKTAHTSWSYQTRQIIDKRKLDYYMYTQSKCIESFPQTETI